MKRLLVYDLDGTLLETLPDLRTAANLAFLELGHPPADLERTRAAIGDGARSLIQRLLPPGSSESEVDLALERFHFHYRDVCTQSSTERTGALDFVRRRAATSPAIQVVLTNKPQAPTDRLLDHLGFRPPITHAVGGDTTWGRKPDPAGLWELMRRAGASPATTLMIGDGPADLAVAQAAGVRSVRLDGGYGEADLLDRLPSTWRVGSFEALESIWGGIETALA